MRTVVPFLAALLLGCNEYGLSRPAKGEPLGPESTFPLTVPLENEPWLEIVPPSYAFPTACEASVDLRLSNVGDSPLVVSALKFDGGADLDLAHALALPLELAPGSHTTVTVNYTPISGLNASGELTVVSNDPRGDQVAVQSAVPSLNAVTQSWTVADDLPIDIVFALDKSCSMDQEMGDLADAAADFIDEIDVATTDWHIGVVSKDDGCFNNGIILPSTPDYEDVFNDAVRGIQILGTSLTESLLQLTSVALFETVPGACNEGFARPEAVLSIIIVSDEPEQSGTDWSNWVEQYRMAKADPNLVVLSAVVDFNHNCGSGAAGYVEAADETGGLILDVCNSDWGAFAAELGLVSAGALRTFELDAIPDVSSIVMSVDGVIYDNGWHYDADRNAVVADIALPTGAVVSVTYDAVGC